MAILVLGTALTALVVGGAVLWWAYSSGPLGDEQRDDAFDEAKVAINAGDREAVQRLIDANQQFRSGAYAVTLMQSASCNPDMMPFLLDDLEFDPRATADGTSAVFAIVWRDPSDPDYSESCTEPESFEALEVLLSAGADPCLAPPDDSSLVPASKAVEWGASPRIADLLSRDRRCE